ncbi:LysR substrate-binding domain-containing protein [Bacillus sp. 1P02SD]|uniref:LysR family transcriptional regulator n=1 Tax=Bacillus sp. 1P02SD TaxID=3132264 RepID=UPI0039A2ACAE
MNLEQIQYIIEVAEVGTISKAAENLHVSHSAISQAIASLESELGIVIFERSRSGSKSTEQGKTALKLSYEIMNKVMELKDLGQKSERLSGELKITAATIYFSTFLPEVLYTFKKEFPQVQITIQENETHEIIKSVKNNQFDIGLILGNNQTFKAMDSRITSHILLQSKLMVCVSKHSPLAYNQVITPEELLEQPLVVRNEELSQIFWNTLFANYGNGNIVFSSNNHDVVKKLIANNIAAGIYTEFWIKNDPLVVNGDIIPIPFFDNHFMDSYLINIISKQKHQSIVMKEFLKCLNQVLKNYHFA